MRCLRSIFSPPLFALLTVACASAPKPAATAAAQASPRAIIPVSKLTGEQIVALQRQGYKLINNNGETLYCATDFKTGSHLQHDNTCLTEKQMVTLREQTQRGLQNVSTPVPPKNGT